ncbi:MAG TPA: gluconokinase [Candidatus Binataceae bacterium]|nr:gluconokinase [Candidatus Binataceae bacterium]
MVILLMGVSGSGKTTIGRILAAALGWEFHDADELHPAANRDKMRRGIPLTDSDRAPWLSSVRDLIDDRLARNGNAVVACSALKQSYRERIVADPSKVRLVYLKGSPELVARRLARRSGHFMPASLLPSQLAALEEPRDALTIDISGTPEQIADSIRTAVGV